MKRQPVESILLLGDQARSARYVRICRHKAIDFAKNLVKGATLSKRLIFRDGWAVIKVANGRRKLIIYTEAGGCTYEFFTSELIEVNYLYTPPFDGIAHPFSVCGKGSFHKLGTGFTTTPLVSLCDGCADGGPPDPTEDELSYPLMSCETNQGLLFMKTPGFWNNLKTQPYMWFEGFRGNKFVVGGHDNAPYFKQNRMLTRFNARVDPLPAGGYGWFLYSIGSQVPKAYNYDEFTPFSVGGFTPGGGERIWGGAILRTANFQLMCAVNQNNDWYIWEAGDWSVDAPPRLVVLNVGLGPTLSHGLQTIQFNSAGTRAVAVLTEYIDGVADRYANPLFKAVQGTFQDLAYGSGNVDEFYGGDKAPVQEEMPWLIEYNINAYEDFGGDWQVQVTVGYTRRYLGTGDWIIAADYLGSGFAYPKDSLVAAFFETRYEESEGLLGPGSPPYWPDDASANISSAIHIKVKTVEGWDTLRTIVMQDNVHTYVSPSPLNDKFGNQQFGFLTTPIEGADETSSYWKQLRADKINALNLKTLSWVRYRFYQTNPDELSSAARASSAIEVWAYNELQHRDQLIHPDHEADDVFAGDPVWPREGYVALPTYAIELLGPNAFSTFDPLLRGQFAWHPKGHWAVCEPLTPIPFYQDGNPETDDFFMVDVVQAAGKRYTHEQLYNAAFVDTRDMTYYNDADDYRGVFMTAGLFRDI